MRPHTDPRARRVIAAVAALGITAYALGTESPFATGAAGPAAQAADAIAAQLNGPHQVRFGARAGVSGRLPSGQPGVPVALEYQPTSSAPWSVLSSTTSGPGGAFHLAGRVSQSGALRVAQVDQGTARAAATRGPAPAPATASAASAPIPLGVQAAVGVAHRRLDVLGGQSASVAGTLLPARAGRRVVLQVRQGGHWQTIAHTATGARGRYRLNVREGSVGSHPARLRFPGDAVNTAVVRNLGRLNVYRLAGASWYGPGGTTACGQSLGAGTLGVANKTLPCGTMVTLRYGGHTVRVPVIDRGPYVAGRDFDLTVATKQALGFGDTGDVWTTS